PFPTYRAIPSNPRQGLHPDPIPSGSEAEGPTSRYGGADTQAPQHGGLTQSREVHHSLGPCSQTGNGQCLPAGLGELPLHFLFLLTSIRSWRRHGPAFDACPSPPREVRRPFQHQEQCRSSLPGWCDPNRESEMGQCCFGRSSSICSSPFDEDAQSQLGHEEEEQEDYCLSLMHLSVGEAMASRY
ncbi:hypothetical protein chiPu_0023405, partial [Chiloscyllium punctatum]|nr:hypothetical protein [Chiloscyllium punctatum]